jgi:hypothetical protein
LGLWAPSGPPVEWRSDDIFDGFAHKAALRKRGWVSRGKDWKALLDVIAIFELSELYGGKGLTWLEDGGRKTNRRFDTKSASLRIYHWAVRD